MVFNSAVVQLFVLSLSQAKLPITSFLIILTVLFVDGALFPKDVSLVVGVPPGKAPIILHNSLLNHT